MAKVLYKITNLIDGKCYIGQTSVKGFNYRMTAHKKRKDRPSLIHSDETKKKLSEKAKLQWQRQRGEVKCA